MPHYKNNREAKYGDPVVGRPYGGQLVQVGNIIDIQPGSGTCNAVLVRAIGSDMTCVNVSDFYHADDAYSLISQPIGAAVLPPVVALEAFPGVCEATAAAE